MMDRRAVLRALAVGAGAAVLPGGLKLAVAGAPTDLRLVVMILRGGMDGLAAVPPYGDPAYQSARTSLAFPGPGTSGGVLDLDGHFGLHPALAGLHDLFHAGEASVVHAAALPFRSRSHFASQDLLESGEAAPAGGRDGWLGRALAVLNGSEPQRALAVGRAIPLILRGSPDVDAWSPDQDIADPDDAFLDQVLALYDEDPAFKNALVSALRNDEVQDAAEGQMAGTDSGAGRPARGVGKAATGLGHLLAASSDLRIAVIEHGGWDTHFAQGREDGRMSRSLSALDHSFLALKGALGDAWSKTVVIAVTEFGRTVAPNGTRGTDHGTGGAMFLVGGAVRGGTVHARWPGLRKQNLYEGRDLRPTTDVRAVFKAVMAEHLSMSQAQLETQVFPSSENVKPLPGLLRSV